MTKRGPTCIWSLRDAAADEVGQYVSYKGEQRYIESVLESLVKALNQTILGNAYELVGMIYDDDAELPRDQGKIRDYSSVYRPGQQWFYSADLQVQGKTLNDLLLSVPPIYRRYPRDTLEHVADKSDFERRPHDTLAELSADMVVLNGLLVILDEPVYPDAPFVQRIMNIHPGVTREDSPYERRSAYATLGALCGARDEKVVDWVIMERVAVESLYRTGASLHYMDNSVDSSGVFHDVLKTEISPGDTILGLRWNNFNNSLFPALHEGPTLLTEKL